MAAAGPHRLVAPALRPSLLRCLALSLLALLAGLSPAAAASAASFDPRPSFHFTPSFGWMNDPNGLSFVVPEGGGPPVYHLFYRTHAPLTGPSP